MMCITYEIIGVKSKRIYKNGYIDYSVFCNNTYGLTTLFGVADSILKDVRKKYKKVREKFKILIHLNQNNNCFDLIIKYENNKKI